MGVAALGDPDDPGIWSGIPAGITHGLRDVGVTVVAINLRLPAGIEQAAVLAGLARTRNRFDAQAAPLTAGTRTRRAGRVLRRVAVDGVVQLDTEYVLPPGINYVTVEDMTPRQAVDLHPFFQKMSPRVLRRWERRREDVYARAQMCCVASHWAGGSLVHDYGVASARVAVVGLGARPIVAASDRSWEPARFLFVGFDWDRKGGPVVLRAFARVRNAAPTATLDVVGRHPPLSDPGVTGHGALYQARAEDRRRLGELFSRATCLVMPSAVEPFGIVHVEAAMAGVPSIGTSAGGPRDIIGEDAGEVVDPHDEEQLVAAMLRLADRDVARTMGTAARERARRYTWGQVAERLLRALGLGTPDGRPLSAYL